MDNPNSENNKWDFCFVITIIITIIIILTAYPWVLALKKKRTCFPATLDFKLQSHFQTSR